MNMNATDLRPLYFNLVLWGERFREYFLDYCLPSLLSPRNIPCLINGRKNKFLICTTNEDWELLQDVPIFRRMAECIEPVFVEIPPQPEGVSNCIHMGVGHKKATDITYRDKAYGIALTPDLLISDGSIEAIQKHALEGKHIVYTAALRFAEELLFDELKKLGVINGGRRNSLNAEPLIATGRELVKAGLKSFHSETMRYEWDAAYFTDFPVACFWKVPGEDGIILHSFSWAPFLLDYSIVDDHKTDTFDEWTFDGDYVYKNFYHAKDVHIVQDSDEIMLVSWAPWKDKELSLEPQRRNTIPLLSRLNKGLVLYGIYNSTIMDPLKKKIFHYPVRWHAGSVTDNFKKIEQKVSKLIRYYTNPPISHETGIQAFKSASIIVSLVELQNQRFNIILKLKVSVLNGLMDFMNKIRQARYDLMSFIIKTISYIRLYKGRVFSFIIKTISYIRLYKERVFFYVSPLRWARRFLIVISAYQGDREAQKKVSGWVHNFNLSRIISIPKHWTE